MAGGGLGFCWAQLWAGSAQPSPALGLGFSSPHHCDELAAVTQDQHRLCN